jgi:hypothetical protein
MAPGRERALDFAAEDSLLTRCYSGRKLGRSGDRNYPLRAKS